MSQHPPGTVGVVPLGRDGDRGLRRVDQPPAGLGGLLGWWERLCGGIYESVRSARPVDLEFRDDDALRDWPGETFAALKEIRARPDVKPLATVTELVGQMRLRRPLLLTVLFSPDRVLSRLLDSLGASRTSEKGEAGKRLIDCWIAMCWIAEAAWDAVTGDLPAERGFASGDGALLRPLAARLRFLVLSEPMRSRGHPDEAWWGRKADPSPGSSGVLSRAFGPESWRLLAGRCQEARREWLGVLGTYQSHPLLSQAEPDELEEEIPAVVFRGAHGWRARPLGLSARPLKDATPLTAEDTSVIADVIECHLLPRFAIPAVARLVLYDDKPRRLPERIPGWLSRSLPERLSRWVAVWLPKVLGWLLSGRVVLGAVAVLAGLAAVGCAAALLVYPATCLAAACYVLIGGTVLLRRGGLGTMWLLRMPAASAVGVFALISFMPGGWLATPPGGWRAMLALFAASFGYLLVEARHHGVAGAAAVLRALLVWAVGAVHALMVSLIGLVVVAPAFVGDGGQLAKDLWSAPAYGHAGTVLALATAWCLAAGVFSQILWDDRPITAPLAHLSWRKQGTEETR